MITRERAAELGRDVIEEAHRAAFTLGRLAEAADARRDTELARLLADFMQAARDYTQAVSRALEEAR